MKSRLTIGADFIEAEGDPGFVGTMLTKFPAWREAYYIRQARLKEQAVQDVYNPPLSDGANKAMTDTPALIQRLREAADDTHELEYVVHRDLLRRAANALSLDVAQIDELRRDLIRQTARAVLAERRADAAEQALAQLRELLIQEKMISEFGYIDDEHGMYTCCYCDERAGRARDIIHPPHCKVGKLLKVFATDTIQGPP